MLIVDPTAEVVVVAGVSATNVVDVTTSGVGVDVDVIRTGATVVDVDTDIAEDIDIDSDDAEKGNEVLLSTTGLIACIGMVVVDVLGSGRICFGGNVDCAAVVATEYEVK